MRQGQNSKRSRGRGSSGRRNNVPTRHQTVDSNGPSVRIRGSAFQVHEKYLAMARDAATTGDRVAAENYLQHAEHYFRIINVDNDGDGRGRGNPQQAERPQQEGQFADGDDGDDGDNAGEAVVEAVTPPQAARTGDGQADEGDDQPAVEFPAGEDSAANGSAGAPAPAPRKPRVPRSPHTRGPRAKRKPAADKPEPSQPEE